MLDKEINQIFNLFSQMRVVVIGDAMVDTYLWGNVERISPEAPIPIVAVSHCESRLGGAANVSLNLQALGAVPVLFSVVGEDLNGHKFRDILNEKKLPGYGIISDPGRMTSVKTRIIGKGQHIVRVDEESTDFVSDPVRQSLLDGIKKELDESRIDVIIMVDYDKGVISPSLINEVIALANKKGIPVAVDPKNRNFNYYRDVDLFKPNFTEFVNGTGLNIKKGDFSALRQAAQSVKEQQNLKLIFITLSELGVFISNGINEQHFPAVIRQIADVSGAGDTVISLASLAMAAKLTPSIMAMMANIAGGIVCESRGVVPVDKNKLIQIMKNQNL